MDDVAAVGSALTGLLDRLQHRIAAHARDLHDMAADIAREYHVDLPHRESVAKPPMTAAAKKAALHAASGTAPAPGPKIPLRCG